MGAADPPDGPTAHLGGGGLDRTAVLRGLAVLGVAFVVVAYGLLGFGIVLLAAPGVLVVLASQPDWGNLVDLLELIVGALAIVGAILASQFLVRERILEGKLEEARLPALWLGLGNLAAAMVGGLLPSAVLTALGVLGAAIFLVTFWMLDRPSDPEVDERLSLA